MKKFAFLLVSTLDCGNAYAAVPTGNDVTTKPDVYYSTNAEGVDSLAILPPHLRSTVLSSLLTGRVMRKD